MTAIVVLPHDHGVIALSDTAVIRPHSGEIMSFVDKVMPYPTWNMIICQSGVAGFADNLKTMMGNEISGMDQYEELFPDRAADLYSRACDYYGDSILEIGFCIAGWSEKRQRWLALSTASYAKRSQNMLTGEVRERKPWEFQEAGMWMCSVPTPEHLKVAGLESVPELMTLARCGG